MLLEVARLLFWLTLGEAFHGLFYRWELARWHRLILLLRLCVLSTFAAWVVGFASADTSIVYVAEHLKNIESITGSLGILWAGAAGANMLFWLGMGESAGWALQSLDPEKRDHALPQLQRLIFPHLIFMGLVLLWHSDPFAHHWPFPPATGAELNPLLQHEALSYHPPLLLLSTASLFGVVVLEAAERITPGSCATATRRRWLCGSLGVLGLGITAGSHWAYHILGWGGWWFWDPIETIALINWVGALALLHHQPQASAKQWWDASSVWATIVLGLILVRGGGLLSVHSFVHENPSLILISWALWSLLGVLWPLLLRQRQHGPTASAGLIGMALIMIIGLSLPVILVFLGYQSSHLSASYYESTLSTCLLFFLILDQFGPLSSLAYLCTQLLTSLNTTPFFCAILLAQEWFNAPSRSRRLIAHSIMLIGSAILSLAPSLDSQQVFSLGPSGIAHALGAEIQSQEMQAKVEDQDQKCQHKLMLTYRGRQYPCVVEKIFYPSWGQELSPISYVTTWRGEDFGLSAMPQEGEFRLFYRPLVRWIWGLMALLSLSLLRQSFISVPTIRIKDVLRCYTFSWLSAFWPPRLLWPKWALARH